jgi:hypothetical protein
MAMIKLESVVQSLLVRDVTVVAGAERIGSRLAGRTTSAFLPFAWLPANQPAGTDPNPDDPATGTTLGGVRAGRSVSSHGSLLSRCLPRRAGAIRRPRSASASWLLKQPSAIAWREVSYHADHSYHGRFQRLCRTARMYETGALPVM